MHIRRAEKKDSAAILRLLSQVLTIHADLRPDLFIPGTTKYTEEDLAKKFVNDQAPVFVAVDDEDTVLGYAFCIFEEQKAGNNMRAFRRLYIDDLCVDESRRCEHVGEALFQYVTEEARRHDCYEIILNVWEGNESAQAFYERMGMKPKCTQMELVLS